MPELIGVLARLNAEGALERLDDVLVDNCRFGLSADFCFWNGHDRTVRKSVVELADRYCDNFDHKTNSIKKIITMQKLLDFIFVRLHTKV